MPLGTTVVLDIFDECPGRGLAAWTTGWSVEIKNKVKSCMVLEVSSYLASILNPSLGVSEVTHNIDL